MPRKPPCARIAITLPEEDLAAADRMARAQDRSRSWIVAEAIRRLAASTVAVEATARDGGVSRASAAVAPATAHRTGLGASRIAQLRRDLSLTPEQRVRAAEETLRLTELLRPRRVEQIVAFDSYEAFLDWKRRRDAGG
jgi:predicted transcriptional regulator